jgi:hypothetical protein
MARLQILIFVALLTVAVGNTEANRSPIEPESIRWYQNPEAEIKLWKWVKKWSNYCLNKYGCHNKQGCLQNINNNVKKCVEFYNERCFAAQPGYSPCDDSSWIQPVRPDHTSARPATTPPRTVYTTPFDQKNVCYFNPCQNEGTCLNVAENSTPFVCICPDGFTGSICNEIIQPDIVYACSLNPCQNGGTCLLVEHDTTSFFCICPDGLTGSICNEIIQPEDSTIQIEDSTIQPDEVNACSLNPCQNGGTCLLVEHDTTSFVCICPDLIQGETCNDFDLCRSNSAEGTNGMEFFLNFVGKYYVEPESDASNLPPGAKVSIFLFYFN